MRKQPRTCLKKSECGQTRVLWFSLKGLVSIVHIVGYKPPMIIIIIIFKNDLRLNISFGMVMMI